MRFRRSAIGMVASLVVNGEYGSKDFASGDALAISTVSQKSLRHHSTPLPDDCIQRNSVDDRRALADGFLTFQRWLG